jgi:uncharacterized membrane protein
MEKLDFLLALHEKLLHLPKDNVEERLNFYNEIIEDRMEEGLSEEEAVSSIGSVDEIAKQVLEDIGYVSLNDTQIKPKQKRKIGELILLILGSPIWLSLLVAVFAIILSLYISIWTVIISLWATFASLIACSFGAIICGCVYFFNNKRLIGLALIAVGFVCAGLGIFLFFGCKYISNITIILTKKFYELEKSIQIAWRQHNE